MVTETIALYSQGTLSREQLQAAVDEAKKALAADDAELSRLGLSRDEVQTVRFEVKSSGGFVVAGVVLAIAIGAGGNLAADAVKGLWGAVLKRVKDDKADDAVGPEQKPGGDGSAQ